MRDSVRVNLALGASASIGFLTACSGGGSSPPTAMQLGGTLPQSALHAQIQSVPNSHLDLTAPNVNGTLVYVCGTNQCLWYPIGSNTPAGAITGLHNPAGIGVDKNGRVYIANADAAAHDVLIYSKGSNELLKTLTDPGQIPIGVAIDIDGTVYVANNTTTGSHTGSVSVYAHGSTSPTSTITDPNFGTVVSLALQENHTLYVCYAAGPNGKCDKFPHADGHGINVISFPGIPTGVATDAAGNVVVNNGFGSTSVYSGANLTLCNSIPEAAFPQGLAFDKTQSDFFVVHGFNRNVTEQTYPGCVGGATLEFTYSTGWSSNVPPQSVVVDPGASN